MLLFLDTEYNNIIDTDLISIGLVSECGSHTFYAERTDFDATRCSAFVQNAVLPLLNQVPALRGTRAEVATALWGFLERLPEPVEVIMDDAGDWDLFIDLLDYRVPSNVAPYAVYIEDQFPDYGALAAYRFEDGKIAYFVANQTPFVQRHHALLDARANLAGFRHMVSCSLGPLPSVRRSKSSRL